MADEFDSIKHTLLAIREFFVNGQITASQRSRLKQLAIEKNNALLGAVAVLRQTADSDDFLDTVKMLCPDCSNVDSADTGREKLDDNDDNDEPDDVVNVDYRSAIFRVLKQVHPDMGISKKSLSIINSMLNDVQTRIAAEAGRLAKYNGEQTMTSREVQTAVRLLLPGSMAKHAVSEGTRAVAKFNATEADDSDDDDTENDDFVNGSDIDEDEDA